MRIIVTERIAEEGIDYLRENGMDVDVKYGMPRDELLGNVDDYDAIIVRSVTKVNQELLEKGSRLKVVGRAGNGIDNIDVSYCSEFPVVVPMNTVEDAIDLANTYTGNGIDAIGITCGFLTEDAVWTARMPYVIMNQSWIIFIYKW